MIPVHRYRFKVFTPHDRPHAAATDRVPLPHHDVGKEDAVFTGQTASGDASPLLKRGKGLREVTSPQWNSRYDFNVVGSYGQYDRLRTPSDDEQCVNTSSFKTPGKTSSG